MVCREQSWQWGHANCRETHHVIIKRWVSTAPQFRSLSKVIIICFYLNARNRKISSSVSFFLSLRWSIWKCKDDSAARYNYWSIHHFLHGRHLPIVVACKLVQQYIDAFFPQSILSSICKINMYGRSKENICLPRRSWLTTIPVLDCRRKTCVFLLWI